MLGPTTRKSTDVRSSEPAPSELHRWRFAIDLLSLALLLTLDGVHRLRMVTFWFTSLCVFPYPLIARSMLARPDRTVLLILGGVAVIGLRLHAGRDAGYGLSGVFFALQVVLTGLWQLAFLKREPRAPVSLGSLLLGGAALACGLACVLLPV
jgi:hypothetical protein